MSNSSPDPLNQFDRAARAYSEARAAADDIVAPLNAALDALKRDHVPALRLAIGRATECLDVPKRLIAEHPEIFVKPKTQVLHGLRIGFMKERDVVVVHNEDATIEMIEAALPDKAAVLIGTEKALRKTALATLTDDELVMIGAARKPGDDVPFIAPVDSEVEKFVSKMVGAAIKGEA